MTARKSMAAYSAVRNRLKRASDMDCLAECDESIDVPQMTPCVMPVMEVVQGEFGGTAAKFFIEHKTDIPSDYEDHKVSIAVLNLTAQFYYEATPKVSFSAFLKSLVTNNTEYPLLAGSASQPPKTHQKNSQIIERFRLQEYGREEQTRYFHLE
ncbi:hypothetical protein SNEBB_003968 [Seison nebaliae]|nr:hypothetical protein SNEBB_003968 [Seison nebaliae]